MHGLIMSTEHWLPTDCVTMTLQHHLHSLLWPNRKDTYNMTVGGILRSGYNPNSDLITIKQILQCTEQIISIMYHYYKYPLGEVTMSHT